MITTQLDEFNTLWLMVTKSRLIHGATPISPPSIGIKVCSRMPLVDTALIDYLVHNEMWLVERKIPFMLHCFLVNFSLPEALWKIVGLYPAFMRPRTSDSRHCYYENLILGKRMGIITILSYRRLTSVDKRSLFGTSSMYLSSPPTFAISHSFRPEALETQRDLLPPKVKQRTMH